MQREIKFEVRKDDNKEIIGYERIGERGQWEHKRINRDEWLLGAITDGQEYSKFVRKQFTGVKDKNGIELYDGSKFLFWICYPTTQTHTGNNIPNGSYTEPDETQFLKQEAEVIWDEDRAKWSFSLLSKAPYQFSQYFSFGWYDEDTLPIIERAPYSLEYIKEYYGYDEMSDEEWQEYLSDAGFTSEQEMMKEVNEIEVVGNIHDVKEQLVNEAT